MIAGRSKSGLILIFSFLFIISSISILSAQQKQVTDSLTSESKTALHQDTTLNVELRMKLLISVMVL